MDCQFQRGDKLILELINSDEVLEGEFVDGTKNRITLINITPYKSDQSPSKGPYCYYRPDIISIRLVDQVNLTHDTRKINSVPNKYSIILLSKLEYERLKEMSHKYIYISSLDARYYNAIKNIKCCENIGIAAITTSFEKTAAINLMIISTWDQVYILDFLILNTKQFPVDLKDILECEHIKKILHDCRLLNEVLNTKFNIKLCNLFDTKVADIAVRKQGGNIPQNTKTLTECLVHYFNFPFSLLATQDTNLDGWRKRPLSDPSKFKAAQMATFLITLKNYLETALLKEFYKSVDDYSKSLGPCCGKDVASKLFDNRLCNTLQNVKLN